jgi:hypothetical protein
MQASKPLNRRVAVILALTGMWFLASIGVFLLLHTGEWVFIGLRGCDAITIGQIGGFFLAWFAAQIPAACFAGMIISSSDFSRPLRVTFWTMVVYHLLFSIIRAFRWPWGAFHDLNQSIPVLACLISVLLLIGVSVLFAWFTPRWSRWWRNLGHGGS